MTKELLQNYCELGYTTSVIAQLTNFSQTTVMYWLRKHKLHTARRRYWDEGVFRDAVMSSFSIRECLLKMGKNDSASGYNRFHRNINKYKIDTSHFLSVADQAKRRKGLKNEEIFIENSNTSRALVKKRIIEDKLIEYKCCDCGNSGSWGGRELVLILDHENGIRNDNRLGNLRFLCPNCNSQLPTHCIGRVV